LERWRNKYSFRVIIAEVSDDLKKTNPNFANLATTDPCSGRVCQHQCPCGKMIYFNLESEINKVSSASAVYRDVCLTNSQKVTTQRRGKGKPKSTQVRSETTAHVEDTGFVFKELKKAVTTCYPVSIASELDVMQLTEKLLFHTMDQKKYQDLKQESE
jgi:hypothetical protein